ncbi:hypothetical protein DJ013_13930 [Arcticibacterium luteifluviistationis]|uniref:Uncharacterized protein n=1 Tax=Arcticibacterium luteifluviistationis TaxID=1784714 RepID=A0A2Z4GDH0_9BACT|nr:hypothetical protein DJ013_13930 [Arcticibacterium luteifluviistationis]
MGFGEALIVLAVWRSVFSDSNTPFTWLAFQRGGLPPGIHFFLKRNESKKTIPCKLTHFKFLK